jgi:hypothetical protein
MIETDIKLFLVTQIIILLSLFFIYYLHEMGEYFYITTFLLFFSNMYISSNNILGEKKRFENTIKLKF